MKRSASYYNAMSALRMIIVLGLFSMQIRAGDTKAECKWGRSFIASAQSEIVAVTTDSTGMVYAAGTFGGTMQGAGFTTQTSKGLRDFFVTKLSAQGSVVWLQSFGGTGDDELKGLALDGDGSVVITGNFRSKQVAMTQYSLHNSSQNADSTSDVFIAKLRPQNGAVMWAVSAQGEGDDEVHRILHRQSGGFVVVGEYESFEFSIGPKTLLPAGKKDVFVAFVGSDGTWITSISLGGNDNDFCSAVAEDHQSNIIIGGSFWSSTMTCGQQQLTNKGLSDGWFAVVSSNGTVSAATDIGSVENESVSSVAVGMDNSIVVQGGFRAQHLRIGSLSCVNHSDQGTDCFVYATNPQREPRLLMSYGGDGNETAQCVVVLPNGDCIMVMNSDSKLITTESNASVVTHGAMDCVLLRIDANGRCLSLSSFGGSDDDKIQCLTMQPNGIIVIGGLFASPSMSSGTVLLRGSSDKTPIAYVVEYNSIPTDHVPSYCNWNIVRNGSFTQGSTGHGVINNVEVKTDYWTNPDITKTPNLSNKSGCHDDWYVTMHGSSTFGESIQQNISLIKGKEYEVTFCAKWIHSSHDSDHYKTPPQVKLMASNVVLTEVNDPKGIIVAWSPDVTSLDWVTYTMTYKATESTSSLSLCIVNTNVGNVNISLGAIDNICIHELIPCMTVQSVKTDTLCCVHQVSLNNVSGYGVSSIGYTVTGGIVDNIAAGACAASTVKNADGTSGTISFGTACTSSIPLTIELSPLSESGDATIVLEVAYGLRGTCTIPIVVHCRPNIFRRATQLSTHPSVERDPITFDSRTINIHRLKFPTSSMTAIHVRPSSPVSAMLLSNVIVDGTSLSVSPSALDISFQNGTEVQDYVRFTLSIPRSTQWTGTLSIIIETGLHDSEVVELEPWIVRPLIKTSFVNRTRVNNPQVLTFRAANPDASRSIAWMRVSLPEAGASVIAARAASDTVPSQSTQAAIVLESVQSTRSVRFQFNHPISVGDTTPMVSVVADFPLPLQPIISLYDVSGNLMSVDTTTMDQIVSDVHDEGTALKSNPSITASAQPNPAQSTCSMNIHCSASQDLEYDVMDLQGRMVIQTQHASVYEGANSIQLDLRAIVNGQYYVRLRTNHDLLLVPLTVLK